MGRIAKVDTPVRKHINLPTSLSVRVDLILFSDVEGKVPHGAWSSYLERLIRQDLQTRGVSL